MIADHNPFHRYNYTALESLRASNLGQEEDGTGVESRAILNADFKLIIQHGADHRLKNLLTVQEFAIVMPDGSKSDSRDILFVKRNSNGTLSARIEYIHRRCPSLLFH